MESIGDWEYNKKDLIGHGAFAVVFRGRNKLQHEDVVAVKCITKKNLAKSQNLLSKEIKILKELSLVQHENVVRLLDCKETTHHVYLVMEYCNGGDLADFLQTKGMLSEDTIASFLKQLAGAMKALNAKGIVHRDLKPQNILLCHQGKSTQNPADIKLKIADFGFARFLQDGVMAATLCGSPMYMAPEVIMSLQYDAKADLWSLGTMMYQCLTGKAPFQAQTPQQLKQYYERNINLVPNIPSCTSPDLKDLLIKMLKRNANDRIGFDDFFKHPFMNPKAKSSSPVPVPRTRSRTSTSSGGSSSPSVKTVTASPLSAAASSPRTATPCSKPKEANVGVASPSERHGFVKVNRAESAAAARRRSRSRSPDGFVLVPENLPSDTSADRRLSGGVDLKEIFSDTSPDSPRPAMRRPGLTSPASNPALRRPDSLGNRRRSYTPSSSPQLVTPTERETRRFSADIARAGQPPSPTRPTSLAVAGADSEPMPVPSQVKAYEQMQRSIQERQARTSAARSSRELPRDQSGEKIAGNQSVEKISKPGVSRTVDSPRDPRHRKWSGGSGNSLPSIGSLSPPSVQFTIGTPPTPSWSRRLNVNTPPSAGSSPSRKIAPGSLPTIAGSPTKVTTGFTFPETGLQGSRSGAASSPSLHGADSQSVVPVQSGGKVTRNFSGQLSEKLVRAAFGSSAPSQPGAEEPRRTQTMPVLPAHTVVADQTMVKNSGLEGPVSLVPPELSEETLLDKEHGETLSKLNFVLALVECVIELAQSRSSPISESIINQNPGRRGQFRLEHVAFVSEEQRRLEQLVLYVRALQLLSASMDLARQQIEDKKLHPSATVKLVIKEMNNYYHQSLTVCKRLHAQGIGNPQDVSPERAEVTADKLIYGHAIEMCQSAALDEMFGHPDDCFRRYRCAQILLHALAQQVRSEKDRRILSQYRESVEKRLFHLYEQGLNGAQTPKLDP